MVLRGYDPGDEYGQVGYGPGGYDPGDEYGQVGYGPGGYGPGDKYGQVGYGPGGGMVQGTSMVKHSMVLGGRLSELQTPVIKLPSSNFVGGR